MAKIHELSANLTNQIAAGEVIERPASVVKELVENSIDAGSRRIRIEFKAAGLKEISVQDNGSGIDKDQIDLAFTRHATSKISNEHDLFKVSTLGFRGEALASIAAVSHVQVLTATGGAIGIKAEFSGGTKTDQEEAAARPGTKITVRDLFFNTPARLKYLRSPRTEIMKIVDIVNRLALGHPDISFTLANEGKVLLRTPGNGSLRQTVANVYGRHVVEKMLPFARKDNDFKITGLMSRPLLTRSNRNFVSILLNGRYIRNFYLTNAIMAGYGSELKARHYPIVVLNIAVDPLLVDVNVHPTKQEVRLSKEKQLGRLITTAISDALTTRQEEGSLADLTVSRQQTLVEQLKFNLNKDVVNSKREREDLPEVQEAKEKPLAQKKPLAKEYVDLSVPRADKKYLITPSWQKNVALQTTLTPFESQGKEQTIISTGDETLANNLPALQYIGQMSGYLLASAANDLYLIDQVAARRRLRFEKIEAELADDQIMQQELLTPVILDFGNLDFLQLKNEKKELQKIGLRLGEFGQNTFILRSYPTWIKGDISEAVRKILDLFLNSGDKRKDKLFERIATEEAKREVSGKKNLSAAEASELLEALRKSNNPYYDAEGQLILVRISQNDLRKMFKKGE